MMMLLHLQAQVEEYLVLKTLATDSCAVVVATLHGITSQNKLIFRVNIVLFKYF
jgi:hypothetical protein